MVVPLLRQLFTGLSLCDTGSIPEQALWNWWWTTCHIPSSSGKWQII